MIVRALLPCAALLMLTACNPAADAAPPSDTATVTAATQAAPAAGDRAGERADGWQPGGADEVQNAYLCASLLTEVRTGSMSGAEPAPADVQALVTTDVVRVWADRSEEGATALGWERQQRRDARQQASERDNPGRALSEGEINTIRECAAGPG